MMNLTRALSTACLVFCVANLRAEAISNSDPDFVWLPPTVGSAAAVTGPFDATALDDLVVEICELDATDRCVAGPPLERFTSATLPMPSRLSVNEAEEHYTVDWLTGSSLAKPDAFYRIRVLKNEAELGTLDVDVVQNTPGMVSVDPSRYLGIVRGQQLTIRFRLQHPTARTRVKINEIESNQGSPGDWIELYNTAAVPLSLAGYRVRDNDDTHEYLLPGDAVIPAHGYYLVEEAETGFGLGGGDSVRLFTPDETVVFDSYTWAAHAPTTYGRCPDGIGPIEVNTTVTKGAANDCSTIIRVNEVESSGGVPGDWVELFNPGPRPAELTGFVFTDNDVTHAYTLPATLVPAGGYVVLEEAAFGFGLGAADSVRVFRADGSLADAYSWSAHASTTYGRCPNGSGDFITTAASTKGAANNCAVAVANIRINEIESSGGSPGDWVELYNPGATTVNLGGFVFKDNDDTHAYTIPAAAIAAGGYFVLDEAALGFGLGAADSVRLFDSLGTAVDAYTWSGHAATTYGRCPNGTGAFTTTVASTKAGANACAGDPPPPQPGIIWPGGASVQPIDGATVFGGNMSGLAYEGTGTPTKGVLWAVQNNPGTLFRLVWDSVNSVWTPDAAWPNGKALRYPSGTGNPDAEGVAFASSSAGGIYVATERNNDVSGISRNSILRFDPFAAGTELVATHEWDVTGALPTVGANLGIEAITWVPDQFLISNGFADESQGLGVAYNPANYPAHGTGLFFVGVEGTGLIYALALNHANGSVTLIATITSTFSGVMELQFDRELGDLWAVCDDSCDGRASILRIGIGTGTFAITRIVNRPSGMANLNNEGFAFAPLAECDADLRPSFWADDGETGGDAIRGGTLSCSPF